MSYEKQTWDKNTWGKGQNNFQNMLNHIEDGISNASGGGGSQYDAIIFVDADTVEASVIMGSYDACIEKLRQTSFMDIKLVSHYSEGNKHHYTISSTTCSTEFQNSDKSDTPQQIEIIQFGTEWYVLWKSDGTFDIEGL